MTQALLTSVTRIMRLTPRDLRATVTLGDKLTRSPIPRERWRTGDYVVGRVASGSPLGLPFELPTGRLVRVAEGDRVIGALGSRAATLEVVGDWRAVGSDCVLQALTPAGLLGRSTSKSDIVPDLVELEYEGHLEIEGRRAHMRDFILAPEPFEFRHPVVLIVGSSMSAGKTTTGCAIVRALRATGRSVVAAKLTGAARYRDVLTLADAGAEWFFDFVDAGLPSTVGEPEECRSALQGLLSRMASVPADVAVIEAGASPLEPYNGALAVELLEPHLCYSVLCASDPYAVVGIIDAFGKKPDLVAGVTANTEAGIALVDKLTGIRAMDARGHEALPTLRKALEEALERFAARSDRGD